MNHSTIPAILALEDGNIFHGISIGYSGHTVGEVVFNTSMTGYQEILTDPSYAEQIVTFTYPHIGNTGVNTEDEESSKIWSSGLIIRDSSILNSSWRSCETLSEYLIRNKIIGISDIDTRFLTHILRQKGALNGCIMAGEVDESTALNLAKQCPKMEGKDLAKEVSTKKAYSYTQGTWKLEGGYTDSTAMGIYPKHLKDWQGDKGRATGVYIGIHEDCEIPQSTQPVSSKAMGIHIVAYDFGLKRNLLRYLVENHCRITVVPAQTPADEVLALKPDGIFLSNGPGDPAACTYAISAIQTFLEANIPLFGVCLGHQLLGLACGAKTVKMKFGHHGANHPVQDLSTKRVTITSQNHGFVVDENTLPACLKTTHRSLFDGSLQGIAHTEKPAFGFQGHPEASPGPHDLEDLFEKFVTIVQQQKNKALCVNGNV